MKKREARVTRKACREQLKQKQLACELLKVLRRFFPGLLREFRSTKAGL